jgi:hypothetical protein
VTPLPPKAVEMGARWLAQGAERGPEFLGVADTADRWLTVFRHQPKATIRSRTTFNWAGPKSAAG